MRLIQVVLITSVGIIMITTLQRRTSQRSQALKKIGLVAVSILAVAAIAAPSLVQDLAELLGIGRGTDLIIYVTAVALLYIATDVYLRFQETDQKISELARRMAIDEAARRTQATDSMGNLPALGSPQDAQD